MINCFILKTKQYVLCELRRENLHTGEMAEAESGSSFNGSFLKRRRLGEGGGVHFTRIFIFVGVCGSHCVLTRFQTKSCKVWQFQIYTNFMATKRFYAS